MMPSLLPSNTEEKKSLNFSRKFKTAKSHAMFLSTSNKMKEKNHPIWNHYKLACSGKYWKALQQVIMTRATVIHVYKVSLVSVGCLCRIMRKYLQYLPLHKNSFLNSALHIDLTSFCTLFNVHTYIQYNYLILEHSSRIY